MNNEEKDSHDSEKPNDVDSEVKAPLEENTDVDPAENADDAVVAEMSRDELIAQLDEANQKISDMRDGYLRAKADVENIRRRTQNEIISARKYAIEGFAQELLSVKDSLDQASKVELGESQTESTEKMKEGLELTLKQLDAALSRFSVTEVEAEPGTKFNPEYHQAISMISGGEIEPDHIVDVMQKGFILKDRLLRPAMVVVAQSG
ncbi:MAG: nucleotide exchange factor GrpE [Gammaproteobacteria bacterium]|nr:nucleotide exchange factor GrpE [Gammaproteobacteria bacterium]